MEGAALREFMDRRFQVAVLLVGIAISAVGLWTLRGCGSYFQTGLFWFLAYALPQLGKGAFIINALFHGFVLLLFTRLFHMALKRWTNPVLSGLASKGLALVAYCLLLFVLFPIRECTI